MVKVSRITLFLLVILIIFVPFSLYFETSLFFGQVLVKPVRVYWKVIIGQVPLSFPNESNHLGLEIYGFKPPNYTISDLKLTIDNAFSASDVKFEIKCENLSEDTNFWDSIGNGIFTWNGTRLSEYERANLPDILITCPSMQNGSLLSWIQVLYPTQPLSVRFVEPLLKQTSFDTWEGEFLFDGYPAQIELNNKTFVAANIQKISFAVTVPNNYQIQNIESVSMTESSNAFVVTKELASGETFHLVVKDLNSEPIKTLMGYVSGLGIPSIVIAILLSELYERKKNKRKRSKS